MAVVPGAFEAWTSRGETLLGPRPEDLHLLLGILGGSIVGKWAAALGLASIRQRWAWWSLLAGLLVWFLLDSEVSAAHGAWFNLWMANLWPLLLVGGALALHPRGGQGPPPRWTPLAWACLVNAVGGLVMAVGINTPLFQVWTSRVLANPDWLGLLFGPIGATICAHFVMLVPAARRGHDRLVVLTVLAWFVVDSARTVAEGAWFNLLLINLPCLVMVGGAALWTRYRLFRDQS